MVFKTLIAFKQRKQVYDLVRLSVKGGTGGQGQPTYGGHGGTGGNIFLEGNERARLRDLVGRSSPDRNRYAAGMGKHCMKGLLLGERGSDLVLKVPPGISVESTRRGKLGEIDEVKTRLCIAKGGDGGSPFNNFRPVKTGFDNILIRLKKVADVGLLGFPNAGKSSLLRVVSNAKPKVANYPFTTIEASLGTMVYGDDRQISAVDLPGVIEGAHINRGMGVKTLRILERTSLLLYVVDVEGFAFKDEAKRSAMDTILLLNKECEMYKPELLDKPAILALNKIDTEGAGDVVKEVQDRVNQLQDYIPHSGLGPEQLPQKLVKFDEVFPISTSQEINIDYLKSRIRELLDLYADIKYEKEHPDKQRQLPSGDDIKMLV